MSYTLDIYYYNYKRIWRNGDIALKVLIRFRLHISLLNVAQETRLTVKEDKILKRSVDTLNWSGISKARESYPNTS